MDRKEVQSRKWDLFWFGLLIVLVFFLFRDAFSASFFQDDWFSLIISKANSLADLLKFFAPRTDVVYYRPLGMQLPFFINQTLTGINPLPIRITTLGIHVFNSFLVFKLVNIMSKKTLLAKLSSFLYATSAIHFTIFYWAATFAFILAPLFFVSSFLLYLKQKPKLSWALFFIGLLANELLVTLPIIITVWELLHTKRKQIRSLFVYWFTLVLYVIFRLIFARAPSSGGYAFTTSVSEISKTLRDYLLWTFSWPEEIHNQFVSFFQLNSEFLRSFNLYVEIFFLVSVFSAGIIIVGCWKLTRDKNITGLRTLTLGGVWFLASLLPVLFYAHHAFAYYLPIGFVGILIIFSVTLSRLFSNKFFTRFRLVWFLLIASGWYVANWYTVKFNTYVHWAPRRAEVAKKLVQAARNQIKTSVSDAVFVVVDSNVDENKWALGDQNAFQYIYNSSSIKTIYVKSEEDNKEIETIGKSVYFLTP